MPLQSLTSRDRRHSRVRRSRVTEKNAGHCHRRRGEEEYIRSAVAMVRRHKLPYWIEAAVPLHRSDIDDMSITSDEAAFLYEFFHNEPPPDGEEGDDLELAGWGVVCGNLAVMMSLLYTFAPLPSVYDIYTKKDVGKLPLLPFTVMVIKVRAKERTKLHLRIPYVCGGLLCLYMSFFSPHHHSSSHVIHAGVHVVRLWRPQITAHALGSEFGVFTPVHMVFLRLHSIQPTRIDPAAGDGVATRGIDTWALCNNCAIGHNFAALDRSAGRWSSGRLDLCRQGLVSARSFEGGLTNKECGCLISSHERCRVLRLRIMGDFRQAGHG